MPLDALEARSGLGGMSPEGLGLYKDLEPFWERIGGDAIYTEAVAHVDALWDSRVLRSWADAGIVVAAHDPHPGIVEGTEGFEYDIVDEDAMVADAHGDGGVPPVGDDIMPVAGDDVVVQAADAMVGTDDGASKPAWGGICCEPHYIAALETVEEVAKQSRDDQFRP